MPVGGCYEENIPFPNTWCEGLVARLRGDDRAARDAFLRARNELEQTIRNQSGYAQGVCALGVVDAALGNKEDAIREGEHAVELIPVSKGAIEGSVLTQYLAIIYAWTGDKDRAIERLTEAAKLPGSHDYRCTEATRRRQIVQPDRSYRRAKEVDTGVYQIYSGSVFIGEMGV